MINETPEKELTKTSYSSAIRDGFAYLLSNYPEVFLIGQGLWSPWYVGNTMSRLELDFGKHRVIDTPVSESAVTGLATGAAITGLKPIVIHPRMDFMLYAMDSVVNEAAKWRYMTGGKSGAPVTIRAIINRGGEQGAQQSQALQSWFSHIPGLRVVMPYSVQDARDLLIAATLCPDPVLFIDDRWLYDDEDTVEEVRELDLTREGPRVIKKGSDLTLVGSSYSTKLALQAAKILSEYGLNPEVIDLRVTGPLVAETIIESIKKTGNLFVIDGGWGPCGVASEVITAVSESIDPLIWKSSPTRITLPFAPAPSSSALEGFYYPDTKKVVDIVLSKHFSTSSSGGPDACV